MEQPLHLFPADPFIISNQHFQARPLNISSFGFQRRLRADADPFPIH
jgi:hypothetical protein